MEVAGLSDEEQEEEFKEMKEGVIEGMRVEKQFE